MMLSRRALLSSSAAVALIAACGLRASAQQAEWAQNYDGAARVRVPRSNTPILSPQALAATEDMVGRYRDIVSRGGWQPYQGPANLRVGSRNAAVQTLRQRLIVEGDLDPAAGASPIYDSYVEAGVRRFQSSHGLSLTGILNAATILAMNVPADTRFKQLELNVVRLRSYSGNLGNRFVIVNIPAALVETVEDGHVVTRHAAGVGKIDRQSPIMNAKVQAINFNPFWTVPASLIKKDLIPKMQKEPNYLTDRAHPHLHARTGSETQPRIQINWNVRTRRHITCSARIRAATSTRSASCASTSPIRYGVYMHDTPVEGHLRRRFPLRLLGLRACAERARLRDLAPQGHAGLGSRA